jgi:hypothetical protein
MTISELKHSLAAHPDQPPTFRLPDGESIPAHFHITEVGFVKKHFIDCGGTIRDEGKCLLQVWVANDVNHRVSSARLAIILEHGKPVLPTDALPVEIEYEHGLLSQFPLESVTSGEDGVTLELTNRRTDCLAKDVCGVSEDDACCGPGCC